MVLLESEKIAMGALAPNFMLPGVDGKDYVLADFEEKKVLIVMFICNHCPYVKAVIDRIVAIQDDYAEKKVALVAISANDADNYPDDSFENMKRMAAESGLKIYLYDEDQSVARAYGAQCTPDMFVYKNDEGEWKLAYHGRIDDNWKDESAVEKQEMRVALDEILETGEYKGEQNPSMGCSIKWKSNPAKVVVVHMKVHDAEADKAFLESQGIKVFLKNAQVMNATHIWGDAGMDGVQVLVPEDQVKKAKKLLEERRG